MSESRNYEHLKPHVKNLALQGSSTTAVYHHLSTSLHSSPSFSTIKKWFRAWRLSGEIPLKTDTSIMHENFNKAQACVGNEQDDDIVEIACYTPEQVALTSPSSSSQSSVKARNGVHGESHISYSYAQLPPPPPAPLVLALPLVNGGSYVNTSNMNGYNHIQKLNQLDISRSNGNTITISLFFCC